MREAGRYVLAALALGAVAQALSEALFWSFPPQDITPAGVALSVLAYGLAAACALSAVIWSGLGGWRGVFLGAAILGFGIEGVIVATMYDAFPFQLVWTPLAWHALVTGLGGLGLHLWARGRGLAAHAVLLAGLGAGLSVFATYWPQERALLPGPGATLAYQLGCGALAVAGLAVLDRLGPLPRPRPAVLWAVPVLAGVLWLAQGAADPRPERLAFLPMLGLTLWAMRRLGGPGGLVIPSGPRGRPVLFLLAPLIVALVAGLAVRGTAGWGGNLVAALLLAPVSLGLWLGLIWQAWRRPSAAPPRG
jgi:hypothetical protein